MATTLRDRAKSPRITDHLQRRPRRDLVRREVGRVRKRLRAVNRRYRDGLKAEANAYAQLRREHHEAARRLVLSRTGRRIHLEALLLQRRPGGQPRWALVDPTRPPSAMNGGYDEDGDVLVAAADGGHRKLVKVGHKAHNVQPGSGFPALPKRVRELASDPKIRKRAEWIGVLYQPEEWREVDPDPALVVKWKGVDGYFALAVWGGDRAQLMEFVD